MMDSVSSSPREHKESAVKHINLDAQGDAVKQFFLSLPVDSEGAIVEVNGHAFARLVPLPPGDDGEPGGESRWTRQKNERRCFLIDREIDGTLTREEAAELAVLQEQMLRERRKLTPVPLDQLRRLHQELLAKAQDQAAKDGA
jgi:hypothetical protein